MATGDGCRLGQGLQSTGHRLQPERTSQPPAYCNKNTEVNDDRFLASGCSP
jgi:hypothetical protein